MEQKQKLIYELLSALFIFSGFVMSITLYLTLSDNAYVPDYVFVIASLLLLTAGIFFCDANIIKHSEKCALSHEIFADEGLQKRWKESFRTVTNFCVSGQLCKFASCWVIMGYLMTPKDYVLGTRSIAVVLTLSALSLILILSYLLCEYKDVISKNAISSGRLDNDDLQTSDDEG